MAPASDAGARRLMAPARGRWRRNDSPCSYSKKSPQLGGCTATHNIEMLPAPAQWMGTAAGG